MVSLPPPPFFLPFHGIDSSEEPIPALHILHPCGEIQDGILIQFSSVVQLCPTLYDPMDCNTPGLPIHQDPNVGLKAGGKGYDRG